MIGKCIMTAIIILIIAALGVFVLPGPGLLILPLMVGGAMVFAYCKIWRASRSASLHSLFCAQCGQSGKSSLHTNGNWAIEAVLWAIPVVLLICVKDMAVPSNPLPSLLVLLLFAAPSIVYSLWRTTTRKPACGSCGSRDLIPTGSPRARSLAREWQ